MIRFPAAAPFLKLPVEIDAVRLAADHAAVPPSAWQDSHWEVHGGTKFILLRGGTAGTEQDFTTDHPVDAPLLEQLPYLAWLISPDGPFGGARYAFLFSMPAQGVALPHVDSAPVWKDLLR